MRLCDGNTVTPQAIESTSSSRAIAQLLLRCRLLRCPNLDYFCFLLGRNVVNFSSHLTEYGWSVGLNSFHFASLIALVRSSIRCSQLRGVLLPLLLLLLSVASSSRVPVGMPPRIHCASLPISALPIFLPFLLLLGSRSRLHLELQLCAQHSVVVPPSESVDARSPAYVA